MRFLVLSILAVTVILTLFLGFSAFLRARRKGRYYALSMLFLGASTYAAFYLAELLQTTMAGILICLPFEYLGVAILTVSMYFVIRDFRGAEPAPAYLVWIVAIVPVLSIALAATVSWNGLLYLDLAIDSLDGLSVLRFHEGIWFYVNLAFTYLVYIYGLVVYLRALFLGSGIRRAQAGFMLAGNLLPMLAHLAYLTGLSSFRIDIFPVAFALGGVLYALGFFRYRLFDIRPIARDKVFEEMLEAALIVDEEGMLIDYNKAARAIFPLLDEPGAPPSLTTLSKSHPGILELVRDKKPSDTLSIVSEGGEALSFETQCSQLVHGNLRWKATLILLRDISERVMLYERLKDLASRDTLTGVANRRFFYEHADMELDRARRHGRPIGFGIMDMNGFKNINDTYGHQAGDDALRLVTRLCVDTLRSCDVMGRIGGDEFAFILPECDEAGAMAAINKLRTVVGSATFSVRNDTLLLSAAFGAIGSAGPVHPDLEMLLASADARMYADKQSRSQG
ncbi:MAG: histidine kinase N-terminal 7TM domain-containing protein [Spirochaetia bacterium]|jgi:diguanylate cyclase (GGDEF)-like protein|nr:histidine kinase N-terminal 7TM domain-containing protein [Spirochaetia bacterium]